MLKTYRNTIMASSAAALMSMAGGLANAEQVEIEYWQYFFEARVDAMEVLIENFEAANPDITVTMTHFPYADYRTRTAVAIPAGEGPDVVQLFYGWLNDYIEAGLIQPLPEETFPAETIEAEFFPMVSAMERDGQYYALPTAVRSLALFYNERLFERAGIEEPPTTLDEMMEIAEALTERDGAGNITQVGITSGMTAQDHHWFREVLIRQFGGEPYTEDYQTVTYDSEAGLEALNFYLGLEENGVSQTGFMDEPQAAFRAGRAGMHIDGSFRIGALNSTGGLQWGVTELPAGPDGTSSNYSSYWVNAITTGAQEGPEYEASVKFMEYITSPEAMEIWLEVVGELPARQEVGLTEDNANDPVFGPFIRGLEYANTTLFANESAQRQEMVDMVARVQIEGMDPAEALSMAAEAEQAILDEYYAD
ncbi:extracellular solute-binding protein [Gymnodinialimonas sp. 2305UL16-5]|uniref:extracellular solute-binding protein n=1 Tax=Gymnodinialimonas mytili TaxID=3126503 RepID=UPI0030A7705A